MSASTKNYDPAFQGAGSKLGTEIWRIENFQPVPLPKSDYGKFYNGDSYIILQTSSGRGGAYVYDIHFWIGKESTQDEAGTAAIKTVELDAVLGGRAVQHRELQGFESDKFLSFFKPCIIPLEGGFASGFRTPEEGKFETRLYVCKGKRVVRMKQVPFSRSTLNHDDVFILDTEKKIYQFNGSNSNIQERGKALEVVQYLKEKYHQGTCAVAIIDDGKFQAESDSGEFWVLFGGFAPLGRKIVNEDDVIPEATPAKLFSINDGQLNPKEGELTKSLLENSKCFLLDCGSEVFIWFGRVTQIEERKAASKVAEDFISETRPKATRITRVIQGHETYPFKCHFESWPAGTGTSVAEEGRGKVAALVKKKGFDFKASSKDSQHHHQEEVPALLEGGGKLEAWRINGGAKVPVPKEDIGKFFCGDCYIVLYAYSGEKKEEYFLICWLGKDSTQDDQMMATRLSNTMWSSLKGKPTQGRIFQGAEPPQFIALFQPMVILKGGLSSGYKSFIAGKGLNDETYTSDGIALIQISSPLAHNNKAIQVDAVATSLSSYYCYVLQSGNSLFVWNGSSSTYEHQQWAARIAEFLKPGVTIKHAKEGTETSVFWTALGGKQNFTSKKITHDNAKDPHLYAYSLKKGKLEISEIYNYSQDDLLPEDMLILDTRLEVFVWTGHFVDSNEKQKAFDIGQQYIDHAVSLEGLSPQIPLYRITEGNEPCFFTAHFSWDSSKATVQGNSFNKRLTNLFGNISSEGKEKSSAGAQQNRPTQRASALAALTSAFNPSSNTIAARPKPSRQGSQRALAVAALSSVLAAEQSTPVSKDDDAEKTAGDEVAELEHPLDLADEEAPGSEGDAPLPENNEEGSEVTQEESKVKVFSYQRLRSKASDPAPGIDCNRREAYLSNEEFESILGMTRDAFYQQPKWKQGMQKKRVDLF